MMDLGNKRVTVIGTAKSGFSAARLVCSLGGKVKISEQKLDKDVSGEVKHWAADHSVPLESGGHTPEFISQSDLVVLSPGVRIDALAVQWAKARGIPVIGEIELGYQFCRCPVIAVTGSNGKTTVSTLIQKILVAGGLQARLCGNVGYPFTDDVVTYKETDYVVLEISSFQLETIRDFRPKIAVFLNLSENHLDRHKDIEEYYSAKTRIFMNQGPDDHAVLNRQDRRLMELSSQVKAKVWFFNEIQDSPLNPNFSAAQTVGKILGISEKTCQGVFDAFPGVEHRMEKVRTMDGVEFINDSKATTAEAGRWAMQRIRKPIILICGGRDKNIDFSVLRDLVRDKVKAMLVIGEASDKFHRIFNDIVPVQKCQGLPDAVRRARECAVSGDCVLLSPMCASFDMFANFEERGQVFKKLVHEL